MSQSTPRLSIVIPHLRGVDILRDCLSSIFASDFQDLQVIVVDNASLDGSAEMVRREFPRVQQLRLEDNRGYAGGCNAGIGISEGEFVLLLNDDAILQPPALRLLVDALQNDPEVAFAQPKLLDIHSPRVFDYSGAAGGLMDFLGYPFAFGRLFLSLEEDRGQYDSPSEIFWACGTAAIYRRRALEEVGLLDEDFFAHMEEIDLAWRLRLAGWKGIRVPQAVAFHHSGHTLPNTERHKMYLNHRNSLVCLLKNYSVSRLVWILPLRMVLEWATIVFSFLRGDFRRGPAALQVQFQFPLIARRAWRKRPQTQAVRRVADRQVTQKMYSGSVVVQHFMLGKKSTAQVLHRSVL